MEPVEVALQQTGPEAVVVAAARAADQAARQQTDFKARLSVTRQLYKVRHATGMSISNRRMILKWVELRGPFLPSGRRRLHFQTNPIPDQPFQTKPTNSNPTNHRLDRRRRRRSGRPGVWGGAPS